MPRARKYEASNLISMFRLAAELRNKMLAAGFTDNGGAIHSASRILDLLGLRLCYPGLSHIANLSTLPQGPFSESAMVAHRAGEKVLIEHVSPLRELTRLAIAQIDAQVSDDEFIGFIRTHYRLALLTQDETTRLNRLNRTRMAPDRLEDAGIRYHVHDGAA